jgi:ParB family chromosome partitioning protein
MTTKKKALGRGLSALLENIDTDITSRMRPEGGVYTAGSINEIDISAIEANPFQPRTKFAREALDELADSIKIHGLIQPITVRKMGNDHYQLISGERRYRASQLAGLQRLPAYIRVANDQEMLELALIENLHREDLDPIEVAISYRRLIEECSLTQEEMANRVGKNRSTVTNFLRLLKLPAPMQQALRELKISAGHARALLSVEDEDLQQLLFEKLLAEQLSVRQMEELVKVNAEEYVDSHSDSPRRKANKTILTREERVMLRNISELYESEAKLLRTARGKLKLVLEVDNDQQLDLLIKKLQRQA